MELGDLQQSEVTDIEGSPVQLDRIARRAVSTNRVVGVVEVRVELEERVPVRRTDQGVGPAATIQHGVATPGSQDVVAVVAIEPVVVRDGRTDESRRAAQ